MTTGNAAGLGEIRVEEMSRSAALLNLRLTQWAYSDVITNVAAVWSDEAGDHATLIRRIGDVIAAEHPDMILTLDPNHGTTCHPAHREIGALVLETGAKNVFFIETVARLIGGGFELRNASPRYAWSYTANDDWLYAVRLAEIHATQFTAEQVESLRTLPKPQQTVWFGPAGIPSDRVCE
jgi:LmbE family N-acetylglucosaminyl deacetylase